MASCARATRGLRRPSLDMRTEGQFGDSFGGDEEQRAQRETETDTIDLLYVRCTGCLGLLIGFCRVHVNHT